MRATENTFETRNELIPRVIGTEHLKIIIRVVKYFNNYYAIDDSIPHVKHHMLHHFDSPVVFAGCLQITKHIIQLSNRKIFI